MDGSFSSVTKTPASAGCCSLRNELSAPVMDWVERSDVFLRTDSWLEQLHQRIAQGEVHAHMAELYEGLYHLRRKCDREEWHVFCLESTRAHPLRELLHQCPYSRHGFVRPRGYAGDAELIDYVYAERETTAPALGQDIYRFLYQQPGPRSVRPKPCPYTVRAAR